MFGFGGSTPKEAPPTAGEFSEEGSLGFEGGSSGSDALYGGSGASRKEAVMATIQKELALANFKDLLKTINAACYKACIAKPGMTLSSSEQKCLGNCTDLYMDVWNSVSVAFMAKLQASHPNQ